MDEMSFTSDHDRHHVGVLIIGAGFSGLGAAITLQKEGYTDFLVVERGNNVGGTWRVNTYPGAACDVPSHLYSYSFAPNRKWTVHTPNSPKSSPTSGWLPDSTRYSTGTASDATSTSCAGTPGRRGGT
jgi:cation diffusion facilitator CzcD-associated flavoprotein CzcO